MELAFKRKNIRAEIADGFYFQRKSKKYSIFVQLNFFYVAYILHTNLMKMTYLNWVSLRIKRLILKNP